MRYKKRTRKKIKRFKNVLVEKNPRVIKMYVFKKRELY